MNNVLLFIPMYNCSSQIQRVLNSIKGHSSLFSEILLIDNRSNDGTPDVARKAIQDMGIKNATILINNTNVNLGGSHKVAFQYALTKSFDHVLVLHGDDQADIQDIIPFLKSATSPDTLLGARFHPDSKLIGYSKFRIFGNRVLNIFCSIACKSKVMDMGSGLNLYSRRFIEDTRYRNFPNNLTFNVYLLFHTYFNSYSISYFPISWKEEDQISNAKLFQQMKIILLLCLKVMFNENEIYKEDFSTLDYSYGIFYKA